MTEAAEFKRRNGEDEDARREAAPGRPVVLVAQMVTGRPGTAYSPFVLCYLRSFVLNSVPSVFSRWLYCASPQNGQRSARACRGFRHCQQNRADGVSRARRRF